MLSNKALLVNLRISQWGARKFDKRATGTVEQTYTTQGKVGNYSKKLLPGAKELEEIQRQAGAIRAYFHEQTLPWFSDGSRILSAKNYLDFSSAFRKMKQDFDRSVIEFVSNYLILRDKAKTQLGSLFSASDYPRIEELMEAFSCEVSFMPVPDVADFRVSLSDDEKAAFVEQMRNVETQATQECWNRLYDVVTKATTRLHQTDTNFRESLLDNITDMCGLLPKLNVLENPDLETLRQETERLVSSLSTRTLRDSPSSRNDAAKKLDEISSKMASFMGA